MKGSPLITVKNVSFRYDASLILKDVDLEIFPGEFIGIFGPNGGGKTTFLKLLMGILKPSKGKILFHNRTKKVRFGYVPQASNLDKQFPITVLELVLMGCLDELSWTGFFSKKSKQKAREALDKVGLLSKEDAPFGTLSGGQAQRALIARAIASDPQVLLLDEPTASADPEAQQEIYKLLHMLKGDDRTILMVTHDLQAIIEKVQKVLCIERYVSTLRPSEVCKHFAMGLYHLPLMR